MSHRAILHVDMDAFFASVEQLDDPTCRGKPVLVGGAGKRGVVAASSYEARAFGCRSAMPMATALRNCPHAIVKRGSFDRYKEISKQVFAILEDTTPLVQPISIDEAFCDITGSVRLLGSPEDIAKAIRARVKSETGLNCSVGVAPNKFLAKLASDLKKPDALVVIDPDRVLQTLDPLPVSKLWGVGPAAERKLARLGLRMVGDIRAAGDEPLRLALGDFGLHLARLSRGEDDRRVHTDREAKSISHERTFGENLGDPEEVRGVIDHQAEDVARRLRKHHRLAAAAHVKIRFGDFETITRTTTLNEPSDATTVIRDAARMLFDRWASKSFRPVRLIGVGVERLSDPGDTPPQLGLFDQTAREQNRALDAVTDAIAQKHGKDAIRRASANAKPNRKT